MIAIIFDIDGTLVESYKFDGEYFISAVKEVLGEVDIYDDWGRYSEVTDQGILGQIMRESGVESEDQLIQAVRNEFSRLIKAHIDNVGDWRATRGAVEFFEKVKLENTYKIGLATGGWKETARIKLRSAGFDAREVVLTSSDDNEKRIDIMRFCFSQLKVKGHFEKVVYFGDGEWDMRASAELDWSFIGVGARLKGKSGRWIKDFRDFDEVINQVNA